MRSPILERALQAVVARFQDVLRGPQVRASREILDQVPTYAVCSPYAGVSPAILRSRHRLEARKLSSIGSAGRHAF